MMGTKERSFRSLPDDISLEELVTEDNFYRRLEERLDLSFVRHLVEDLYAHRGRPSVDPEVFFKLHDREVKGNFYRHTADLFLSKTDPDASPISAIQICSRAVLDRRVV